MLLAEPACDNGTRLPLAAPLFSRWGFFLVSSRRTSEQEEAGRACFSITPEPGGNWSETVGEPVKTYGRNQFGIRNWTGSRHESSQKTLVVRGFHRFPVSQSVLLFPRHFSHQTVCLLNEIKSLKYVQFVKWIIQKLVFTFQNKTPHLVSDYCPSRRFPVQIRSEIHRDRSRRNGGRCPVSSGPVRSASAWI